MDKAFLDAIGRVAAEKGIELPETGATFELPDKYYTRPDRRGFLGRMFLAEPYDELKALRDFRSDMDRARLGPVSPAPSSASGRRAPAPLRPSAALEQDWATRANIWGEEAAELQQEYNDLKKTLEKAGGPGTTNKDLETLKRKLDEANAKLTPEAQSRFYERERAKTDAEISKYRSSKEDIARSRFVSEQRSRLNWEKNAPKRAKLRKIYKWGGLAILSIGGNAYLAGLNAARNEENRDAVKTISNNFSNLSPEQRKYVEAQLGPEKTQELIDIAEQAAEDGITLEEALSGALDVSKDISEDDGEAPGATNKASLADDLPSEQEAGALTPPDETFGPRIDNLPAEPAEEPPSAQPLGPRIENLPADDPVLEPIPVSASASPSAQSVGAPDIRQDPQGFLEHQVFVMGRNPVAVIQENPELDAVIPPEYFADLQDAFFRYGLAGASGMFDLDGMDPADPRMNPLQRLFQRYAQGPDGDGNLPTDLLGQDTDTEMGGLARFYDENIYGPAGEAMQDNPWLIAPQFVRDAAPWATDFLGAILQPRSADDLARAPLDFANSLTGIASYSPWLRDMANPILRELGLNPAPEPTATEMTDYVASDPIEFDADMRGAAPTDPNAYNSPQNYMDLLAAERDGMLMFPGGIERNAQMLGIDIPPIIATNEVPPEVLSPTPFDAPVVSPTPLDGEFTAGEGLYPSNRVLAEMEAEGRLPFDGNVVDNARAFGRDIRFMHLEMMERDGSLPYPGDAIDNAIQLGIEIPNYIDREEVARRAPRVMDTAPQFGVPSIQGERGAPRATAGLSPEQLVLEGRGVSLGEPTGAPARAGGLEMPAEDNLDATVKDLMDRDEVTTPRGQVAPQGVDEPASDGGLPQLIEVDQPTDRVPPGAAWAATVPADDDYDYSGAAEAAAAEVAPTAVEAAPPAAGSASPPKTTGEVAADRKSTSDFRMPGGLGDYRVAGQSNPGDYKVAREADPATLADDAEMAEEQLNAINRYMRDKLGMDASQRQAASRALIQAGATMMSTPGDLLTGIGAGLGAGVDAFDQSLSEQHAQMLAEQEAIREGQMDDLRMKKLQADIAKITGSTPSAAQAAELDAIAQQLFAGTSYSDLPAPIQRQIHEIAGLIYTGRAKDPAEALAIIQDRQDNSAAALSRLLPQE